MALPRGITRTPTGYRASLRVNGVVYQKRFKASADVDEMERWRAHTRADAERDRLPTSEPGTFAADAEEYLKLCLTMPTYREREQHIKEWVEVFGALPRSSITPKLIQAQREKWLTVGPKRVQRWRVDPLTGHKERYFELVAEPLSASSVSHRMRALENLWTRLDGKRADNPVREVDEPEEPEPPPRALPMALIRRVLEVMPDSVAKAWLMVLAWTGTPHKTIARMTRAMVDLRAGVMWVPGRKKGKGSKGRRVPLTADGKAAWTLFIREGAWRTTAPQGNMARSWRAACRRVMKTEKKAEITRALKHSRVYDLRHSIGTLVAEGGDFADTTRVLGVTMPTAMRYAKGALDPRLVAAVARLEAAQQGGESPAHVAIAVATKKKRSKKR